MQGLRFTTSPSTNVKLTGGKRVPFYATYRAVGPTCPSTCALLDAGCYAQGGNVNLHQRGRYSLNDGALFLAGLAFIPPGATVRLHVSGDVMLDGALDVDYLRAMIDGAAARPDVTFFGYTHAWKLIDRAVFVFPANFVLNASCDGPADVDAARAAGWDTTTVVPSDTPWRREGDTVVCPQQTVESLSCAECKLCMRSDRSITVAFRAHGSGKKKVDAGL